MTSLVLLATIATLHPETCKLAQPIKVRHAVPGPGFVGHQTGFYRRRVPQVALTLHQCSGGKRASIDLRESSPTAHVEHGLPVLSDMRSMSPKLRGKHSEWSFGNRQGKSRAVPE